MWAHAILLSQSLGGEDYRKIVEEFAGSTLKDNQTLKGFYLSRPSPNFTDFLTDWTSKLIAILQSRHSAESVSRILQLGDTLWKQSIVQDDVGNADSLCLAAHVCYVLVNRELDNGSAPVSKYLLVGANHIGRPHDFVTVDSLHRTEILEYLALLGAHRNGTLISFAMFQPYKLIYSTYLADIGKTSKAKRYLKILKERNLSRTCAEKLEVFEDALEGGKNGFVFSKKGVTPESPRRMSIEQKNPNELAFSGQNADTENRPRFHQQYQESQGQVLKDDQQSRGQLPGQNQHSQNQQGQYQQAQLQPQQNQRPTPGNFPQQPSNGPGVQASNFQPPLQSEQQGADPSGKKGESSGWFSKLLVQAIHGGDEEEEPANSHPNTQPGVNASRNTQGQN